MALALKPGVNETAIKYLTSQGVGQDFINAELAKPGKNNLQRGMNIDPSDYGRFLQGWQNYQTNQLINSPFSFDANQYLPGIQQTAASIYDPQRAQIQALSQLSASQAQQAKVETKEQFAQQLQREVEAINARGAFFGGGALNRQSQIGTAETRALTDLDLQQQAAQAGFLAQQAGLSAAQAQYIQDKLSGTENSAYSRWLDQRNFAYERQQNDRDYALRIRQIENDERMTEYQKKQAKKQAKEDKRRWEEEMAYKYYATNQKSSSSGGSGIDW